MTPARPKLSVIVNNHNYQQFLPTCLQSVRDQTRAPDEVIVVDDGSTDGSRAYLAEQSDVTVLLQDNRGQAAAFNAGFAAATGEAILFLDADDALKPHALETIEALWTGRPSILCYHLDMVDARGTKLGRYPMTLPDEDMLPRLLNDLMLPFMPTSGNVFAREAIEWAFPLPEPRWRISADALLIRAALLVAPIRLVNQTLADYRVHGSNNFFRNDVTRTWQAHRGLTDLADVGLDLAQLVERAPRSVPTEYADRVLRGVLNVRMKTHALAPDPVALRTFLRKLPARILPPPVRWALQRSPRLQEAVIQPSAAPAWANRSRSSEPVEPRGLFYGARDRVEHERTLLTAPDWAWVAKHQTYVRSGPAPARRCTASGQG
ncbi:MAG: glycosyltransferase family A protein [Pseudomonadota bacterium]